MLDTTFSATAYSFLTGAAYKSQHDSTRPLLRMGVNTAFYFWRVFGMVNAYVIVSNSRRTLNEGVIMVVAKLIQKGYVLLTEEMFEEIAVQARRGEWSARKVFHTCEKDGYEAVDARGRVHGTNCCGSMAVLSYYKYEARRKKEGPLPIKAD